MLQSIPAALGLATATVGHLPAFSVLRVRHLQILRCPGPGVCPEPWAIPEPLTRMQFPIRI